MLKRRGNHCDGDREGHQACGSSPPGQNPLRLTTSSARGFAARVAAYGEWRRRYGGVACARVSHGWHAAMCEATGPVTRCQATVLNADYGCGCDWRGCQCVGDLYYRGACLHCRWEGPVRDEQTQSVCDGLDHAHPGWRSSPTVAPPAHDPSPAQKRRWRESVDELYGDRPDGHPIITERTAPGTRAVTDRSPWGGYDVAACTVEDAEPPSQYPVRAENAIPVMHA